MANSANVDFATSSLPKTDCFFFVRYGMCSYGENCKYNHPPLEDLEVVQEGMTANIYADYTREIPCKFFHAGFCMYGNNCNFNHSILDPALQYNSDGLPMRMGVELCSFYMYNRWCGYGEGCKFHHPELYLVPDQAQEYDDGLLGSDDEGYPLSATNSP